MKSLDQITHPELVAALVKPGQDIIDSLTPQKAHLWHMASCIPGEVAELVECLTPCLLGLGCPDSVNLKEEFGDIEFYLEGLRTGFDMAWIPTAGRLRETQVSMFDTIKWSGQLFDLTKKFVIYNKPADLPGIAAAFARMEQALADLRAVTGVTRDETLKANIAKLSKRYVGLTYSDKSAQERADKVANIDTTPDGILETALKAE